MEMITERDYQFSIKGVKIELEKLNATKSEFKDYQRFR